MRTIFRRSLWILAALGAAAFLGGAAMAVAPALVVPPLAKAAAGAAGVPLRIGEMRGNFRDGFTLRNVSVGLPAADVSFAELSFSARWNLLIGHHLSLTYLTVERPVVRAHESAAPPEEEPGEEPAKSAWRVSIDRIRLRDGAYFNARAVRDLDVDASLPGDRLVLLRARARFEDSEIRANGSASPSTPKGWALVSARGPLSADVRLRGEGKSWTADGRAKFRGASASFSAGAAADDWKARASFAGADPAWFGAGAVEAPLSGTLAAEGRGLRWPPDAAQARVRLAAPEQRLAVAATLRSDRLRWDADLEGDVSGRLKGTWNVDPTAPSDKPGRRSVGAALAVDWELKARRPELARWTGGSDPVSTSGRADARRDASGWSVRGRGLRLSAGPNLDFEGEFSLARNTLVVPRLAWRTPGGQLVLQGTAPLAMAGGKLPDFDVSLHGRDVSWAFLKGWLGDAEIEDSSLDADLRLTHRRGVFTPAGTLRLRASRIKGTVAGLDLRDFSLSFAASQEAVRIAEGSALTKNGRVTLAGSLNARGPNVSVHADRLAFRVPGEVSGEVSGDAALKGRWAALTVIGDVNVRRADYRPEKKKKDKKKKMKERPGPKRAGPPGPLAMDLRIRCDRDAWFKDGSNYIEMKGDLRVRKDRWEPVRLVGTIETLRGQYGYYGRTFVIQEGKVRFSGETPIDPALRVRALYLEQNSGTKVFLDVGGTAGKPTLALSSLPPLEEQDILSILAFGRPLDQGGQGPGGSEAAQSLVANYLLQQTRDIPLVRRLDLDILQVQKSAEGGTSLTVGRYLSRDLFVSYDQTLGETGQRRLNAEYTFTPHWSLFGRRSDGSQYIIDLLFKYGVR